MSLTRTLVIDERPLDLGEAEAFVFGRGKFNGVELAPESLERVRRAHSKLYELLEKRVPIYGVTTGFGDSCFRVIPTDKSEALQRNLIAYLSCGTGPELPEAACKAALLFRLKSLSRGYSGVSVELLERMKEFLERGWTPVIPREGSLGASGDLIPLAYIAGALQGEGEIRVDGHVVAASEAHSKAKLKPYVLKPKEGLALVNGTSAMSGICLVNLAHARGLADLATLSSAWLCLALRGRIEAFGELVNEKAKSHAGQALAAKRIRGMLEDEDYQPRRGQDIGVVGAPGFTHTEELIQDRYSLRCAPQILGPVLDTIELASGWLQTEINGVSDNPLIDDGDSATLAMGGNFYGGYLGHGMDYLKISLANVADLLDRQLAFLIDDKSNRGLPPNLADWESIPESERFLHHGLKGLHQAVNAVTSEILARATPNTIFSRSSESHNQDKVSLGMSAAVQCSEMITPLFTTQAMVLVCLAQALDLRGIRLRGAVSRSLYQLVRDIVPRVTRDVALGAPIRELADRLRDLAEKKRECFMKHDVIVIGGGPGGSTLAAYLAKKGYDVGIFERETYPRFHIGESLLPASMPIFKETGFYETLAAGKYIQKYGARFVDYASNEEIYFGFDGGFNSEIPMAFEVERAEFDRDILEHAKKCGATVYQPGRVKEVSFYDSHVSVKTATGEEYEAKYVADATGRDALISRQTQKRVPHDDLNNVAVFAHYVGVKRQPGRNQGDIIVGLLPDRAWSWIIPFQGEKTSVGVVCSSKIFKGQHDLSGYLRERFEGSQILTDYMGASERTSEVTVISNYSHHCTEYFGDRWILVGDAAAFLDPIFSSGVHVSCTSARFVSSAIDECLKTGKGFRDSGLGAKYQADLNRGIGRFHNLISMFYSSHFVHSMKRTLQRPHLQAAFTSAVAGDMWNEENVLFKLQTL